MRKRTIQIHLRATEQERLHYQRNAQKCGLSLSEYLRKLANGHEPQALPPLEYGELLGLLTEMYDEFRITGDITYAKYIVSVLRDLQAAIAPVKRGYVDGNDENLAGS